MDHTDFKNYLQQSFWVDVDSQRIRLSLINVDVYTSVNRPDDLKTRPESFSLVFRGPNDPLLQQGIVRMKNENLDDALEVFLVPIGPDEEGLCYEAVFN